MFIGRPRTKRRTLQECVREVDVVKERLVRGALTAAEFLLAGQRSY